MIQGRFPWLYNQLASHTSFLILFLFFFFFPRFFYEFQCVFVILKFLFLFFVKKKNDYVIIFMKCFFSSIFYFLFLSYSITCKFTIYTRLNLSQLASDAYPVFFMTRVAPHLPLFSIKKKKKNNDPAIYNQ